MNKSLILTSSSENFSSYDGTPSGRLVQRRAVSVQRRAVSDGPLHGSLTVSILVENTLSFSIILTPFTYIYILTLNKWSRIRLEKHEDIDIGTDLSLCLCSNNNITNPDELLDDNQHTIQY